MTNECGCGSLCSKICDFDEICCICEGQPQRVWCSYCLERKSSVTYPEKVEVMEDHEKINEITAKALNAAQKAFFACLSDDGQETQFWDVDFTAYILDVLFTRWRSLNYISGMEKKLELDD